MLYLYSRWLYSFEVAKAPNVEKKVLKILQTDIVSFNIFSICDWVLENHLHETINTVNSRNNVSKYF